jgi:predicted ester cyclase
VERFTARGTHEGEWFGIPATGKRVEVAGILIHRIVSEKTEEIWEILDAFSLLEQLGVALPVGQNDE